MTSKYTDENTDKDIGKTNRSRGNRQIIVLAAVVVIAAVSLGILFGNWLTRRQKTSADLQRIDEHLGLADRTGFTGDITLQTSETSMKAAPGKPARVKLTLKNAGKRTVFLNGWLEPTPAELENNQFPLKVIIKKDGKKVEYQGNFPVPSAHKKSDFFRLNPGEEKVMNVDITRSPGNGRWSMYSPGKYSAEIWYETYLTGKYVGVNAWTGMTNHVMVQIDVTSNGAKN